MSDHLSYSKAGQRGKSSILQFNTSLSLHLLGEIRHMCRRTQVELLQLLHVEQKMLIWWIGDWRIDLNRSTRSLSTDSPWTRSTLRLISKRSKNLTSSNLGESKANSKVGFWSRFTSTIWNLVTIGCLSSALDASCNNPGWCPAPPPIGGTSSGCEWTPQAGGDRLAEGVEERGESGRPIEFLTQNFWTNALLTQRLLSKLKPRGRLEKQKLFTLLLAIF